MREGKVYLVWARYSHYFKIGFTTRAVEERINDMVGSSPLVPMLIGSIPGDRHLEREIHKRLAEFRVNREWYWFSEDLAAEMFQYFGVISSREDIERRVEALPEFQRQAILEHYTAHG